MGSAPSLVFAEPDDAVAVVDHGDEGWQAVLRGVALGVQESGRGTAKVFDVRHPIGAPR
jgi:hypothetical protein